MPVAMVTGVSYRWNSTVNDSFGLLIAGPIVSDRAICRYAVCAHSHAPSQISGASITKLKDDNIDEVMQYTYLHKHFIGHACNESTEPVLYYG